MRVSALPPSQLWSPSLAINLVLFLLVELIEQQFLLEVLNQCGVVTFTEIYLYKVPEPKPDRHLPWKIEQIIAISKTGAVNKNFLESESHLNFIKQAMITLEASGYD